MANSRIRLFSDGRPSQGLTAAQGLSDQPHRLRIGDALVGEYASPRLTNGPPGHQWHTTNDPGLEPTAQTPRPRVVSSAPKVGPCTTAPGDTGCALPSAQPRVGPGTTAQDDSQAATTSEPASKTPLHMTAITPNQCSPSHVRPCERNCGGREARECRAQWTAASLRRPYAHPCGSPNAELCRTHVASCGCHQCLAIVENKGPCRSERLCVHPAAGSGQTRAT